jgi:hypothetical protein
MRFSKFQIFELWFAILLFTGCISVSCTKNNGIDNSIKIPVTKNEISYSPTLLSADLEVGNPGKGYYQWSTFAFISSLPKFDINKRFSWRELETSKDEYNFAPIDAKLAALKKGERFSLRIMPLNIGFSSYKDGADVPRYIIDEKLGWIYPQRFGSSDSVFVPDWNNEVLLARIEKFVEALGKRYDNDPRIAWVETGMYGNWAEWHCYPIQYPDATGKYQFAPPNATYVYAPKDAAGKQYREGTIASKRRIFYAHATAFPHTQLIQSTSDLPVLFEALNTSTANPIGMRRDSWGNVDFTNITMYKTYVPTTTEWNLFNNRWKTAPFYAENWGGKFTTDADMVSQLEHYKVSAIGFGNFGSWDWSLVPSALKEPYLKCGRRTGYRYQISQVDVLVKDSTFNLTTDWKNVNIAPTYENWLITAYIVKPETGELFSPVMDIPVNLKLLLSYSQATIKSNISIKLKAGWKNEKLLKMRILVKDRQEYLLPMNLDMTGRNADGSYNLFSIEISNGIASLKI